MHLTFFIAEFHKIVTYYLVFFFAYDSETKLLTSIGMHLIHGRLLVCLTMVKVLEVVAHYRYRKNDFSLTHAQHTNGSPHYELRFQFGQQ